MARSSTSTCRSHRSPVPGGMEPRPMSTTSTLPQRCRAGSTRWQGLSSPKVTVCVAQNASAGTAPLSAPTPEGRSTAMVGTEKLAGGPAHRGGQPAGRPLHQGVVPDLVDNGLLDPADGVHPVRLEHQASQITTAEAMPASWERLTWMVPTPTSAALAATVPVTLNSGRPRP